jgi:hypothetical protein
MRLARSAAHIGEKRNACRIFVGMPEEETSLERLRLRWDDNIKMYLREM